MTYSGHCKIANCGLWNVVLNDWRLPCFTLQSSGSPAPTLPSSAPPWARSSRTPTTALTTTSATWAWPGGSAAPPTCCSITSFAPVTTRTQSRATRGWPARNPTDFFHIRNLAIGLWTVLTEFHTFRNVPRTSISMKEPNCVMTDKTCNVACSRRICLKFHGIVDKLNPTQKSFPVLIHGSLQGVIYTCRKAAFSTSII